MYNEDNLVGGEAIAAGGFGCVFRPALKCQGISGRSSGVSKLLIKKYAESEYDEIQRILPIIEAIPNNEDYFIAKGITTCKPDSLTSSDLKHFDRKCGNLTKRGITSKTINTQLSTLGILNTIDGGVDVQKYITGSGFDISTFNVLNENLIRLLKFGIIPMNSNRLYHFDVKGANILVGRDSKCRLIDWGLAEIQHGDDLPRGLINKPVHFNLPFGVVMFSIQMQSIIDNAVKFFASSAAKAYAIRYPTFENIFKDKYKKQIIDFLKPNGHYRYLEETLYPIFIKKDGWKDAAPVPGAPPPKFEDLIIEHIATIVNKYTNSGKTPLNYKKYFNEIFKHNADIWGFLMSYIDLYYNKPTELNSSNPNTERFYRALNIIMYTAIFSLEYTIERYDINAIMYGLKGLSQILGHDIGRLTPKTPSPIAILPPSPPSPRVPTPPPTPPAVLAPAVAGLLCDPAKEALCAAKGKVCNPKTGRCIISKIKAKARAKTPTPPVIAPVIVAPAAASLCEPAKIALCKSKGKVCNTATGRCVAKLKTKKISSKKPTPKASSVKAKTASRRAKSSSGVSLGTRKRCPRGYRLDSKTKKCKKIK